jgi:hypothetical protein
VLLSEDECEQSGEACIELSAPQPVVPAGAAIDLLEQPGRAKHSEVVTGGGFGDREVERSARAGEIRFGRHLSQDRPAHRVTYRTENLLQRRVGWIGVRQSLGAPGGRLWHEDLLH